MAFNEDGMDRLTPVDPSQMPGRASRQTSHQHAAGRPSVPSNPQDPDSTVYFDAAQAAAASAGARTAPRTYGAALRAEQLQAQGIPSPATSPAAEAEPEFTPIATQADREQSVPAAEQAPYATGAYDFSQLDAGGHCGPKRHRGVKIALSVVAGLLVAAYAGGAFAFSNLYYPGTQIAGIDVSLMTADDAAEHIAGSVQDYQLHISGVGLDWTYTPAEGSFSVDAQAEAEAVLSGNEPLLWPYRLATGLIAEREGTVDPNQTVPDVAVTYDEEDFTAQLGAAIDEVNATRPGTFDAAGAYDEAAGAFTVAKARSSQRINRDAIIAAAKEAIARADRELALDDSMYEEFASGATDEQLQAACDAANEIIGVDVTLKLGDKDVATLDGATMTQWITFDENLKPVLNESGLTDWIRNLASTQLDTVGTERTYTRPDGKQVTISGGTYGWVSDEATLAQLIQDAVANKQTGEIQIPTKQTAAQYNGMGGRDWGAYVDIDITEQRVRYYDANDQLVWESGCITGNPSTGHDTPTGIYFINNKEQNVQLTGAKDPETGEPEYISYVDYWMSFIGGAVGLHDADWQASSSFNDPTAYTWTGSHGCVNLPPDKAAELFNIVQLNDCVIVHM